METIIDEDLPMQVDVTQWHPKSDQIIAVGAYQLSPTTTDLRLGRLYLLQLTPNVPGGFSVVLEHETKGGVLDLKFHALEDDSKTLIAIATSSGVYIFDLVIMPEFVLIPVSSFETSILNLYLEWINDKSLIFSDADGYINLVNSNVGRDLNYKVDRRKKLHDALTWICHYSNEQDILYAGCDDGKFTAFELGDIMRDELHFVKKFDVGVTSICSKEEVVVVGGYDDILKIFELVSKFPKPMLQLKTQLNLKGAIWRTMFVPRLLGNDNENIWMIAVAAARRGIKFVEYDRVGHKLNVAYEQMKYEGFLAYGLDVKVDWVKGSYLVASGYFDNHVVHCFKF